jgi:hypothetical protein
MLPKYFASFDVLELGLVTQDDLEQIREVASAEARPSVLRGDNGTSLEIESSRIPYRLLDGEQVKSHAPHLNRLYNGAFLQLAERVIGARLLASPQQINGVNVNVVEGSGGRYEWHVDSNPLTGLLVLTDVSQETGGRLLFGRRPIDQVQLSLFAGQLLIFDARRSPHSVEPLRAELQRFTAPMNFFLAGEEISRPAGLDEALYESPS